MTSFANNFLWACYPHHLVVQLNRPSTQFSESRKDTCRCLATYICQYISVDQRLAIRKRTPSLLSSDYSALQHGNGIVIDRVEFSDIAAPYVYNVTEC